jgi:hypothetical protein
MNLLAEWTSIPEAWLWTRLFIIMLSLCLAADYLAKRFARQIPKGADAWNPEGTKLRMTSDVESLSKN